MSDLQIVDVNFKPIDLNHKDRKVWTNIVSYPSLTTTTPPTSLSNSNINFNIYYPNSQAALDANLSVTMTFTVTLTGTTTGTHLYNPGQLALRDFPLNTAMFQVPTVAVNSVPINTQPNQYLRELLLYKMKKEDLRRWASYTVTCRDNCSSYDQLYGSVNSPLGTQLDAISGISYPGGSGVGSPTIISNTTTSAVLQWTLTENIMVFPFNTKNELDYAIFGGNTVSVQLNLANDLSKIIRKIPQSQGALSDITTIDVNINSCVMNTTFYTLPLSFVKEIPALLQYPYKSYKYYKSNLPTGILPGQTFTVSSQNIQVNSIPENAYVFAKNYPETQNDDNDAPSMLCPLTQISVNWNNQSSFLSTCSRQQLYDISCRNGLDGFSFREAFGSETEKMYTSPTTFVEPVGVPFCMRFGIDLPLDLSQGQIVGMQNNQQFQVTCNFWNNSGKTINNGYLVILLEYDGVFEINRDGTTGPREAPLTPMDIAMAKRSTGDYFSVTGYKHLRGGNIFSKIKKVGHFINKALKSDLGKAVSNAALDAASVALPQYSAAIQTAKAYKTKKGYGLVGGKVMTEKQMKQMKGKGLVGGRVDKRLLAQL